MAYTVQEIGLAGGGEQYPGRLIVDEQKVNATAYNYEPKEMCSTTDQGHRTAGDTASIDE
jgi:hypothetical protein